MAKHERTRSRDTTPAAPPTRARLPFAMHRTWRPRQVFGLSGARADSKARIYWASFPSSRGAQCCVAGRSRLPLRGSSGFALWRSPDSLFSLPLGIGTAGEHKILWLRDACQRAQRRVWSPRTRSRQATFHQGTAKTRFVNGNVSFPPAAPTAPLAGLSATRVIAASRALPQE